MTMSKKPCRNSNILAVSLILPALVALSACDRSEPLEAPAAEVTPDPEEPVSIFRPEAEVAPAEAPLASLEASIEFGEGGYALNDAAKAQLATILQSPQMQQGDRIILRGHTDSMGNDEANLRVSKRRAEAVQDYLIESGVAADRFEIIALGEMRPIAPNAKLDGTPDEEGRAANRRVDVTVTVPGAPATAPTLATTPTPTPTSSTLVDVITSPD